MGDSEEDDEIGIQTSRYSKNVSVPGLDAGVHYPTIWTSRIGFICASPHQTGPWTCS